MELQIHGKTALVGGGASGLGFETAKALVQEGVDVTLVARTSSKLEAASKALSQISPSVQITTVVGDLSTPKGSQDALTKALESIAGFDILILNSGGPKPGTIADLSLEDEQTALDANFLSMVALIKGSLDYMEGKNWGRVVAITSFYVREPAENMVLSNTSRVALTAYMKSASHTYAQSGVTFNTVQPGLHLTDRLLSLRQGRPVGQDEHIGSPQDFGQVVTFLCSHQAGFINGASIVVDGGASRSLQ